MKEEDPGKEFWNFLEQGFELMVGADQFKGEPSHLHGIETESNEEEQHSEEEGEKNGLIQWIRVFQS